MLRIRSNSNLLRLFINKLCLIDFTIKVRVAGCREHVVSLSADFELLDRRVLLLNDVIGYDIPSLIASDSIRLLVLTEVR
jgi:hypothetical protein